MGLANIAFGLDFLFALDSLAASAIQKQDCLDSLGYKIAERGKKEPENNGADNDEYLGAS